MSDPAHACLSIERPPPLDSCIYSDCPKCRIIATVQTLRDPDELFHDESRGRQLRPASDLLREVALRYDEPHILRAIDALPAASLLPTQEPQ